MKKIVFFFCSTVILFAFISVSYGQENIKRQYSEGAARILIIDLEDEVEKYGIIDKTGKIIVSAEFDDARNFSEGLAQVSINGKWGYIDKTGKVIIPPQFNSAYNFVDGMAVVEI